jgi:hypothetical protein
MLARAASTDDALMSKPWTRRSGSDRSTSEIAVASPVPSSTTPSCSHRSCERYCSSSMQTEKP